MKLLACLLCCIPTEDQSVGTAPASTTALAAAELCRRPSTRDTGIPVRSSDHDVYVNMGSRRSFLRGEISVSISGRHRDLGPADGGMQTMQAMQTMQTGLSCLDLPCTCD